MTRPPPLPFEPGSVWLAGAGPGDPGLLTLHALSGLQRADVIVHDALIDARILDLARPEAAREFVGKRAGRLSTPQAEITGRLIALARAGRRVLRLKGGDPYVFGRGAEEALALAAAGVPFRVVPGVTAGLGGLAAAGIPATARDTNHAVILATGHYADDATPDDGRLEWAALARTGQPLVIYMGLRNLDAVARALVEGGLSPATPVAVVSQATMPDQRVVETTLARAAADVAAADLQPPAVVAVGSIVMLRRLLGDQTGPAVP